MAETVRILSSHPSEKMGGKPKRKPATRKPSSSSGGKTRQAKRMVVLWAHRYTYAAVVLSSALNAYSTVSAATDSGLLKQAGAGLVSALIPVLVWGLAQLAGWLHKASQPMLAKVTGSVGVGMLLLSVWHVSEAIALLTGQSLLLSILLAIGIDCGLVVSELAAIVATDDSDQHS